MTKLDAVIHQYKKAVKSLENALKQDKNEFIRDSAIQRFEFCFDLSWKLMKSFLEEKYGVVCASPKTCIREAYKQGFIDYDDFWIEMTDMRNKTSHTYHEEMAEEIFSALPEALQYFQKLLERL